MAQNARGVAGLDVAKDKVDACIRSLSLSRTFASTEDGRREFTSWLRRHKVGMVVMEASGGYEREWANAARAAKVEVRIVDPKRVRDFARCAGRLAKNDRIDCDTVGWFAEIFNEASGQPYDAAREQLHQLVNGRQTLQNMQVQLQNQGEHKLPRALQREHSRILKGMRLAMKTLDAEISALIEATPRFAELAEIIESVPGLARSSAAVLIATMPELGQVGGRIAAALLGVAPYDDDSGRRRGDRHVKGGRRRTRNALYMPCVGAVTKHNPVLKAYYERLLARGKLKMVALTACMRKLICILNVMIARGQKWDANRYVVS